MSWWLLVAAAYVAGAVPFSLLTVRWLRGVDVRQVGSGNPGATNVLRAAGRGAGLAVLLLDVAKGALPVIAGRALEAPAWVVAATAVAAVVGHVFSVFLGFRGGKGVATSVGALAALEPRPLLVGLLFFGLLVAATRYVSLGSIALVVSVPAFGLVLGRLGWMAPLSAPQLAAAAAIALLVVARHGGNIRRLLAGTERRLGEENAS